MGSDESYLDRGNDACGLRLDGVRDSQRRQEPAAAYDNHIDVQSMCDEKGDRIARQLPEFRVRQLRQWLREEIMPSEDVANRAAAASYLTRVSNPGLICCAASATMRTHLLRKLSVATPDPRCLILSGH